LQDQELEVSHQLADALRQLELNFELTDSNFNRTLAADRQVEAVKAAYDAETVTLDQLLEAQRLRSDAQTSYFRTLMDYQRAIIMVHYRKGSLLEYNNVYLAEGPWPAKAMFDAHRLARQRDASLYMNYGFTRPGVMSQGPVLQNANGDHPSPDGAELLPTDGVPREVTTPEELPRPERDMIPAADGARPRPGFPAGRGETQSRLRPASAAERVFEWGALGLKPEEIDSDGPARSNRPPDAQGSQPEALWGPKQSPAAPGEPASGAGMTPKPRAITQDSAVETVTYQKWKFPTTHESFQNRSPGPALGSAASGQGT